MRADDARQQRPNVVVEEQEQVDEVESPEQQQPDTNEGKDANRQLFREGRKETRIQLRKRKAKGVEANTNLTPDLNLAARDTSARGPTGIVSVRVHQLA